MIAALMSLGGAHVSAAAVESAGCSGGPMAASAEAVPACGEMTFTGAGGAWARVSIPEPVTVRWGGCATGENANGYPVSATCGLQTRGDSPLIGAMLVEDTPYVGSASKELFLGNYRSDYGQVMREASFAWDYDGDRDRTAELPAGTWRVYLVNDGSGSLITLRFNGLAGSATVEPSQRAPFRFREVPRLQTGLKNTLWSAGTVLPLQGAGYTWYSHTTAGATNAGTGGYCNYDRAPSPEQTAYLPGCPSRVSNGGRAEESSGPFAGAMFRETIFAPRDGSGQYAMGYWHAAAAPAFAGDLAFALDLSQP